MYALTFRKILIGIFNSKDKMNTIIKELINRNPDFYFISGFKYVEIILNEVGGNAFNFLAIYPEIFKDIDLDDILDNKEP